MILFESCVCCGQLTLTIISIYIYFRFIQGATTAEKSRGDQVFRPNTRALAPRARPKAELGVGCRMGSPPPAVMGRGITPWKFLKTQMLKPTFWWLLWNFLLFENYGQEVGGNTLVVPQPKSWGYQSPPVPTVVAPMKKAIQSGPKWWEQKVLLDSVIKLSEKLYKVSNKKLDLFSMSHCNFRSLFSVQRWCQYRYSMQSSTTRRNMLLQLNRRSY